MLLIHCPYCDEMFPEVEFTYAGQAHIVRPQDPAAVSDEAWRDFLFIRANTKGLHVERWRHTHGCGRFFNVVRDTVSDRILATYKIGTPMPDLSALKSALASAPEKARP
ncbi:MAG: sarcosine oxidase subunit delta [Pseudomonadota bacterium]